MKLGFIGFGEAASEMARGFKGGQLQDIMIYDVMQHDAKWGPLVKERVDATGVAMANEAKDVFDFGDVIMVAVPGSKAVETAKNMKAFVKQGQIYADVTATSPDDKKEIGDILQDTGALVVDVAMLGALKKYQHKVPILASGSGAQQFHDLMTPYGMKIDVVEGAPGRATSIKLVRSIFTKGMPQLLFETLEAAKKLGVEELVVPSLMKTMSESFEIVMNRFITGTAIHCERRSHEVESVVEMLDSIGVPSTMSQGTLKRIKDLCGYNLKSKFNGHDPKTWEEVIDLILAENK